MTGVVYTSEQQRLDIATVRHALVEPLCGPDRRRAAEAFERLLRRFARSEDDTVELPETR